MPSDYVRPAGVESEEVQAALERSGVLAGLAVEWVELPVPGVTRWFQFRAGAELAGALVARLQPFAAKTVVRSDWTASGTELGRAVRCPLRTGSSRAPRVSRPGECRGGGGER